MIDHHSYFYSLSSTKINVRSLKILKQEGALSLKKNNLPSFFPSTNDPSTQLHLKCTLSLLIIFEGFLSKMFQQDILSS